MHAFVIPRMTLDPHAIKTPPEAPARTLLDHAVEDSDHGSVSRCPWLWDSTKRRPGESHNAAGSLDRQVVFPGNHLGGLALHGRHSRSVRESPTSRCQPDGGAYEGFPRLQAVLTRGQYVHPRGVQYGGAREEASNRALRAIARRETRGARRIAWIDVHTGLGRYGEVELISELPPDDPGLRRARAFWGAVVKTTASGESVSAAVCGSIDKGLPAELRDRELTLGCAEFGTVEAVRVFWAMRADNWLHVHGDPDSERGRAIRDELLAVFRPADPVWMGACSRSEPASSRRPATGSPRPDAAPILASP